MNYNVFRDKLSYGRNLSSFFRDKLRQGINPSIFFRDMLRHGLNPLIPWQNIRTTTFHHHIGPLLMFFRTTQTIWCFVKRFSKINMYRGIRYCARNCYNEILVISLWYDEARQTNFPTTSLRSIIYWRTGWRARRGNVFQGLSSWFS